MAGTAHSPTTVVLEMDEGAELVVGRVDASRPDLALVDALARLQLVARRHGWRVRVRDPTPQLDCLLQLVGLSDVIPVEPRRQAELGEELRVDEVMEPGDPAV